MSQISIEPSELEIEHALSELLPTLQIKINMRHNQFKAPPQIVGKSFLSESLPPKLLVEKGRVYHKLLVEDRSSFGGCSQTVYGFVRRKDGAIFRAATFKQPETRTKTAIRGFITDEFAEDYFTGYGVIYAL